MSNDHRAVWIRVFVGRSFLAEDEQVWNEIRKMLQNLRPVGLEFEDASEAQPRPISKKIREGIDRTDVYIGILTRRFPIYSDTPGDGKGEVHHNTPQNWGTSSWVVQESGYALGKDKRVILLLEEGVDFPKSDLDADQERVIFTRDKIVLHCSGALTSMIGNLIAEKVPRISSDPQLASPPERPPAAEQQMEKTETQGPSLKAVLTLVDEGNFSEADREFQNLLKDRAGAYQTYVKCIYLRARAVRGDRASLEKLEEISHTEPSDFGAWIELSNYYSQFNRNKDAAEVLIRGSQAVNVKFRFFLIERAANCFAEDRDYDAAYDTLRKIFAEDLPHGENRHSSFIALADIAKRQKHSDLEAAALERALDINPADSDTRFRLAYLYSEQSKPHLAMYHYRLHLSQTKDETSANNLAIAFGELGLSGKEIELYQAAGEMPLAVANVSHAFIDGGFLQHAEELARKISRSDDEQAQTRAALALQRIADQRTKEDETEEAIKTQAEEERKFRARYAGAFLSESIKQLTGTFQTKFGTLKLEKHDEILIGTYEHEEKELNALGSLLAGPGVPGKVETTSRTTLRFDAVLQGRSGRFKFEATEKRSGVAPLFDRPKTSKAEGLLIIAEDERSFEIFDESQSPHSLSVAHKIEDAGS
jgi:thioredoxin-like negative regulator of GroEL